MVGVRVVPRITRISVVSSHGFAGSLPTSEPLVSRLDRAATSSLAPDAPGAPCPPGARHAECYAFATPMASLRLRSVACAFGAATLLLTASLAFAAPPAPGPAPLPTLPGANAAGSGTAAGGGANPGGGSSSASTAKVGADTETLRKGVVQVEQAGRPIAVGTVLSRDGRVITSLSALGTTEAFDVRYADNTVVKAKLGHKDKAWDLALLIPQSGRWLDGLMPTDADPSGGELKAFLPKGGKLAAMGIGLKGRSNARSREGDALKSVLDIDLKGSPNVPGAAVLDPNGRVVAVLVRACKDGEDAAPAMKEAPAKEPKEPAKDGSAPNAPAAKDKPPACSAITIGAPVYALRGFLMKTPANAVAPAPWLGLGGAPIDTGSVKGVRVVGVAPGSPAEKAGLKVSADAPDTIVAVDGVTIETPEQLAEAIAKHSIGQTVKLLVFNQGKIRETPVTLRAAP